MAQNDIPVRPIYPTSTVAVVIPARNEDSTIAQVIGDIRACSFNDIIVVDDASSDATAAIARAAGATVLPLSLRLGAWGATQAGIRYALRRDYQTVVTMDGDGQHRAAYIDALLEDIDANRADVVIGACPERASRARRLAWSYFRLLTGLRFEDITSGFRAYNRPAMQILASAEASLLDYQDVGVLLILRRQGLRTREVPTPMNPRANGASRVFGSWWTVGNYMLQTSLLCLARVGSGSLFRRRRKRNVV